MKEQFLKFINDNQLFDKNDTILLTVSGGMDSITMLHLFAGCGFKFAIAHCNFGLRDIESDGDEEFVSRMANKMHVPIHIKQFNTIEYAEQHKLSIQMAARELRYNWFNQLAENNHYDHIAAAHNANDVVETFFINLTRGTGIHGLTGINLVNKKLIRPLLFATRAQIRTYVLENQLSYREDSSNAETKYMRNAIRHTILPRFEELNPSFLTNLINTTRILKEAESIYNMHLGELQKKLFKGSEKLYSMEFEAFSSLKISPAILFELLLPFGFTFDTAVKMLEKINGQPGAVYFSNKWKIIKDRTSYLLQPLKEEEHEEYYISQDQLLFEGPINLSIEQRKVDNDFSLKRNREVGTFDADKIKFPLKLRRWQFGDFFHPFGMVGKKKLSDYFTNQKLSLPEKENIWILCSGEDIIWVVNHRTDNRYCIAKNTKEVLQIELLQ